MLGSVTRVKKNLCPEERLHSLVFCTEEKGGARPGKPRKITCSVELHLLDDGGRRLGEVEFLRRKEKRTVASGR